MLIRALLFPIVALLGLFMVPLLYPYRTTGYSRLPFWTKPWANPYYWRGRGYGRRSLPLGWVSQYGSGFKSFYRYHALHKPASGL